MSEEKKTPWAGIIIVLALALVGTILWLTKAF